VNPLWIASGAGLASSAGFLSWAVRGRSAELFGPSVWRGDSSRRTIALTFDDGPSESTPKLLEALARHSVKATFFMCGKNVRRLPVVAKDVAIAGHQVGNHSDSHTRFDFRSTKFMEEDLMRAQKAIYRATGVTPIWFRAPYGVRWFGLGSVQTRMKLTGAMWTTIGNDWALPAEQVSSRVLKEARNGAIVCLHDGRELRRNPDISSTIAAVEYVIPRLRDQGYQFETLSEIQCATKNFKKMPHGA
jgi:peptidoglycan-N-acetylglucosamine deacetylase